MSKGVSKYCSSYYHIISHRLHILHIVLILSSLTDISYPHWYSMRSNNKHFSDSIYVCFPFWMNLEVYVSMCVCVIALVSVDWGLCWTFMAEQVPLQFGCSSLATVKKALSLCLIKRRYTLFPFSATWRTEVWHKAAPSVDTKRSNNIVKVTNWKQLTGGLLP